MGRRRQFMQSWKNSNERSSLGDANVDTALGRINQLAGATANVMTQYDIHPRQTIAALFHADDIVKAQAVKGIVEPRYRQRSYEIMGDVTLKIDWTDANNEIVIPPIEPSRLHVQPAAAPLLNWIEEVRKIHLAFEEVKAVLKWLNRNATPAAIRYYWPTAMKLVPESPIWATLQEVPNRYTVPLKIANWSNCLKSAANTVTGSTLLPHDAAAKERSDFHVTFGRTKVIGDPVNNEAEYTTDSMSYNL
jgi:hypothetical protein